MMRRICKPKISEEERLYNALNYTQYAYFAGEQIYPLWENVFAVIISGFYIVYFTLDNTNYLEKSILCLLGFIFSFNWFRIVNRNFLFSKIRTEKISELEKAISQEIEKVKREKNLDYFSLEKCQKKILAESENFWNKKPTWMIRKSVPKYLSIIWLFLLIYTIFNFINYEFNFINYEFNFINYEFNLSIIHAT